MQFPRPLLFGSWRRRRSRFDIGWFGLGPLARSIVFAGIFDGRTIGQAGNQNWSYFDSPKYNRLSTRRRGSAGTSATAPTASSTSALARDAAPAIPIANLNAIAFVSARAGCVVLNPYLDLTAVCLK